MRRSLFVQPAVVAAPPPSNVPTATSTSSSEVRRPPPPKVNQPKLFLGKLEERDGAEMWLSEAMNWLKIAGASQPEDMRVLMFGTLLSGEAHLWYTMVCTTAEQAGVQLTVQDLSSEFLLKYEGGTTHMMRQQQLTSLVYGKGKCVDVVSTQTEFERLSSSLFPGASLDFNASQLLALSFSQIYLRGDIELWKDAVKLGPITLDDWKAAIQQAFIMRQTVAEGRKALQRTTGQTPHRPFHSTSSSSSARLHQMDTANEEEGRQGGETDTPVEGMNKMGTRRGAPPSKPSGRDGKKDDFEKSPITWAELQKFKSRGQCFHCYKAGHRAQDCPDKDKPKRRPTQEELNL